MSDCQNPSCANQTRTKYCSQSCAAQVNNRKYPKRTPNRRPCAQCGEQSLPERVFCSKLCRETARPARRDAREAQRDLIPQMGVSAFRELLAGLSGHNTLGGQLELTRETPERRDMSDRKLATIETVAEIHPIPDADAIERARIRGWDVVVRRGDFQVGDRVVYFEVDSLLDITDPRFAFLGSRGVRTDAAGNRGHVLKTARLRGQYSQGLVLPLAEFPEVDNSLLGVSDDVTDVLGVVKWDAPVPACLAGEVRGMRPSWIPKTDEERIQNIVALLDANFLEWTPTEKIDGTSASFAVDRVTGDFHVCSRNLDLLEQDGNTLWAIASRLDVKRKLLADLEYHVGLEGTNTLVLQGEVYGEGIQGNPLKLRGQHFAAFNLVADGVTLPRAHWPEWVLGTSVPVLDLSYPKTVEEALAQVETLKSSISPDRLAEGVVWRCSQAHVALPSGSSVRGSWKAVSSKYLLKNDR